ncbi:MAG: homoserine kinase [Pseudomonadota bacterium]
MKLRSEGFAPASIGNLGVGFDVLGLAIEGPGDTVRCEITDGSGCEIESIVGDAVAGDVSCLPVDASKNTASIAAEHLWAEHGNGRGIRLSLQKGTPLASGMGSSAASAVAAVMAVNALIDSPLPKHALLPYALAGETVASGAVHADNVAPSLFGGLILCPPKSLPSVRQLPVPEGLSSVLVHPQLHVETAAARAILAAHVALRDAIEQAANLATLIDAAHTNDALAFATSAVDRIVEPQRKQLVKGFDSVQQAAMASGALSCSLSGSGPSVFALCRANDANVVAEAMVAAFAASNVSARAWRSSLQSAGATAVVLP